MPQTLITVFEDRRTKIELTSSQSNDILAFRNIIGENNLSLSCDGYLHVSHFVGFLSKGKTRLQILPKIYEDTDFENENEKREAMSAMFNLLRVSDFDKILGLPDQSSFAKQADIMEVFISIFAQKVSRTYSRQMNREYISISENSAYVKGRIDFSANLRENPVRKDLHIVNFQSFEHDNIINNTIKTVCIKLIRLTSDSENKKDLKKALVFLDDAKEILLSKDLFNTVKFNRLNMPFKPVFEMAKMFFYNLTPQSYQGDDTVCSFLIPLNELFEYYIYKLFNVFEEGMSAFYQNTRLFAKNRSANFRITLRPDIVLRKGKLPILVADAKYKNPKYQDGRYNNISQTDIYQIFAYAKSYEVDQVALIYPQFAGYATSPMVLEIGEADKKIHIIVCCVDIKDADISKSCEILRDMIWPGASRKCGTI